MKRWTVLIMAGLTGVACSDPATNVLVGDLVGTWNATQYVFTNKANTSETFDMISAGGSFSLAINADSTYTGSLRPPGEQRETFSGTVLAGGTTFTIASSSQGSSEYTASRTGNTLTLTASDERYDFDSDTIEEPATVLIVLQRL